MKKQTVFNVVIHQGGGFRFGVICGEYLDNPPEKIIIRNLGDKGNLELAAADCLYTRGSIYSKAISEWISQNGFGRKAADNMHLFKFYYERVDDAAIFEYVGVSEFVKTPDKQHLLIPGGLELTYKKEELIDLVWKDKEIIEQKSEEIAEIQATDKANSKIKPVLIIMLIVSAILFGLYNTFGFDTITSLIPAVAMFFFGSKIILELLYRKYR